MAETTGYAGGEPLAEVVRSGFVEGYHRGSVIVLGADGEPVAAAGDVTEPIFPRSSNKPMQATGMLRAGFAPAGSEQLAVASASHHGEPAHIVLVLPLGLLFGWLRWRTDSLAPSLVAHILNNGFALLAAIYAPGI